MTPEQLKASIIFSALQGKLVEQIDEEPSVDTSKIKSKKTEAIEFDIPEKWKVAHIETVTTSIASKQYQIAASEFKTEGKHPVVSQSKEYVIGYCDDDSKLFHHEEPVVIFGDHTTEVKYIDFDFVVGADGVKIFEPISNVLFVKFLKYVLEFYSTGLENVGGYTRHYKYIKDKALPLPPLEEQHRIVAKIEELLPLVDRYAASYEKLEQFNAKFPEDMKKSILQYAIQGKLVEQRPEEGSAEELYKAIQEEKQKLIKEGKLKKTRALPLITEEEIPFDFPKTWKICYIDDIAFVTKLAGFEYTKYIADNLVIDGIPLFKGKNVQNGKLVLEFESFIPESVSDELPRSQITKKCLLTPYVGTIGNIAIFDGTFKAHLGSNVGKIEILNSNDNTFVLEEYLLWYLRSQYGYNELTKYKKATAQESISIDAIRNVIIAIPPLEEQHRIVAKIEELLPYCDRLVKRC